MAKLKVVSTRKLHPGMRIGQAVKDKAGHAMIESGAYLDDIQIEYLLSHGIGAISIREDNDPDEIEVSEEAERVIEKERKDDRLKNRFNLFGYRWFIRYLLGIITNRWYYPRRCYCTCTHLRWRIDAQKLQSR